MIRGSFTNLRRAHQVIVDAKQVSDSQDKKEELKAIMRFGAGFRGIQSKILGAFALGILLILIGIALNINGIFQKTYAPMGLEGFQSESKIKGYVELQSYITGIFGVDEQIFGNINDMDLQFYLVVDEFYLTNKNAYAVLGMTKGQLRHLLRDNPDFNESLLMNDVNFQGLTKKTLPVEYVDYFKDTGVNLSDEIPLIIAYQYKSTKIQSLLISLVMSAFLLIIALLMQLYANKKYRPKLSEHEIFVKNLLEREV